MAKQQEVKSGTTAPTPEAIRRARAKAGLTQSAAAKTVNVSWRTWARWEAGSTKMRPAFWELFLIRVRERMTP